MSNVNPAQVVDAPFYSQEFGEFLSSKAARLAEVLRDYNPYLELVFIPSSKRGDTDTRPFAIRDNSPWRLVGGEGYIVRHLTIEEADRPTEVLQWLFEGDLSKHGVSEIMARSQAKEAAEKLMNLKREQDIAEERKDLAEALLVGGRDKKNFFRHGGKVFTNQGARHASSTVY